MTGHTPTLDHLQRESERLRTLATDNFEKALAAMEEVERLKAALRIVVQWFDDPQGWLSKADEQLIRAALSEQEGK